MSLYVGIEIVNHDCVIALYDYVPTTVTNPIAIGALRSSDATTTWQDDVVAAFERGSRVILSGDIQHLNSVIEDIGVLRTEFVDTRVALLIHWSQALTTDRPSDFSATFEKTYVAIDRALTQPELQLIQHRWPTEWVFIPAREINWHTWIPENLLPSRRGLITVLSPRNLPRPATRKFLTADELALNLHEFSIQHPLIQFQAAPAEWFISSELGPWSQAHRDFSRLAVLHDSRREGSPALSVIIPFRWSGIEGDLTRLKQTINSISETFHEIAFEIIIVVDRSFAANKVSAEDMQLGTLSAVVAEHLRIEEHDDWRASFVRNCGARLARPSSNVLMFLDADTVIADGAALRSALSQSQFEILSTQGTSSLIVIRRTLLERLGGFAEAFSTYGCEVSFLIWRSKMMKAQIETLSREVVRHLREPVGSDDFALKIRRLQRSSNLMFRMSLDRNVHRQWFPSMGPGVWARAAAQRAARLPYVRPVFAILVFILTVLETENRLSYLGSFYDGAVWKLKHPLFWLRNHLKISTISRGRNS